MINNIQNAQGGANADGLQLVIISRGSIDDPTFAVDTPMAHTRNIKITMPTTVNIRSAVVSTDSSDNVYLTAADEAFLFYKFDYTLT